jgi:NAD-dependent SIR2 family protein deacetylase
VAPRDTVEPLTPREELGGTSDASEKSGAMNALVALLRGRRLVALTGAGLSTDSGIPDYRSPEALARPRTPIQGPDFRRSERVRRRYWARAVIGWERFSGAQPNAGHRALAELEAAGVLSDVITQNVDRLHHAAGSRRVIELHGALAEVECLGCGAIEPRAQVQARMLAVNPDWLAQHGAGPDAPDGDAEIAADETDRFALATCLACAGALKPKVVFFGENVARAIVEDAFARVDAAGALLVVGSSLTVFSGYRFLLRAHERGIPIAIVNHGPVRGEDRAALKLDARLGAVLPHLASALVSIGATRHDG